jgi:hypothetical protein
MAYKVVKNIPLPPAMGCFKNSTLEPLHSLTKGGLWGALQRKKANLCATAFTFAKASHHGCTRKLGKAHRAIGNGQRLT